MFRGARSTGTIRWGTIAPRSQYVLILLAVTFTWLMGLMGFARSGIRQHWHVYAVLRDTSAEAVTPALGYAANVITVVTIVFFLLVSFIFWLGGLSERGKAGGHGHAAPVIAGSSEGAVEAPSDARQSLEARSSPPPPGIVAPAKLALGMHSVGHKAVEAV
jgi:hypothetical protein